MSMFFIQNLLWYFWFSILIVIIGNFITEITMEYNNMQSEQSESSREEEVLEKATKETTRKNKKATKRKKKSKSNNTCDDVSVEKLQSLFNDKLFLKSHPFHLEVDRGKDVTKIFSVNPNMSNKYFVVNEDVFLDLPPAIVDEEYRCYHLYKVMKSQELMPKMDVHDEKLTEEDLTEDLLISEEATKHGVIINSNVYLTTMQWNTVLELDKDIFSCTICQFQCDAATVTAHIRSLSHVRKLDGQRPLKRFDLSITRKIKENLHCAVCNTVYPIKNYRDHENLKSHEEKLLSAINKVTDLLYTDGNNLATFSFNINNIQAPNNAPNSWLNFSDVTRNDDSSPRAESYSPRNMAYSPRAEAYSPRNEGYSPRNEGYSSRNEGSSSRNEGYSLSNEGYSPRHEGSSPRHEGYNPRTEAYSPRNDAFMPSYENSARSDFHSENRVQTKDFHFKNTFGNIVIYEEEELEEYTPPIEGISYASMASKPRVDVPKFLKIDLGTKEVRVKYESWNMITRIDCNQLYCMVCKSNLLVRHKIQHCLMDEHKALLARCNVVGAFEDYLIRDVNEKLYHCGHCNNLQVKNDIQLHIEKYHPIKNGNIKDINPLQIFPETKQHIPKPPSNTSTDQAMKQLDIFGIFKFSPFGTEIAVTNDACHTLMLINNRYICALCNTVVQGDLVKHVFEAVHMQYIVMTPFIRHYQSNLIRAVKYHCEGPAEYKTEMERFLSTLPADSREALSRLTIKNHKGELVQLSDDSSSISPSPLSVTNSPTPGQMSSYPRDATGYLPSPLLPGQMLTVSMLESGLPGVRTGSPVAAFRPPLQLQTTGPMDLKLNHGVGRIPVSPIRRQEDLEVANDLLSLYKQSPIQAKAPEKKQMEIERKLMTDENLVINIDKMKIDIKMEVGKRDLGNVDTMVVKDKTADKTNIKKMTGKSKAGKQTRFSTSDEEELPFKLDEPVLLKIKTSYFRVTNTAYQTLVHLSNGSRYCFVCSQNLDYSHLQKHVDSRGHIENMAKNKFLCNFYGQLLRQMYLMYHCAICNVTMSRREIKAHLAWATHTDKLDIACKKLNKKILKEALREGVKELLAKTQKEFVYVNIPEPSFHIVTYVQSVKENFVDRVEDRVDERKLVKKCQMIILKGTMLKISFESWHGIVTTKSGMKCILCQTELAPQTLPQHVASKYHNVALGIPFDKHYYPALVRKINENTTNCVICNLELPNESSLVVEHVSGRKHENNYSSILEGTARADGYSDCCKYPVTL